MKKICLFIALLLVAALLLTACGPSIVGVWTDSPYRLCRMNYKANGTCVYSALGMERSGTYRVKGNEITVKMNGIETTTTFSISGDTMTMEGDQYVRVK